MIDEPAGRWLREGIAKRKLRGHAPQNSRNPIPTSEPGRLDLLMDFAYPRPVIVIAELMGVPVEDRARFKRWSDDIVATLGGSFSSPDLMERAARSGHEISEYFREIIAQRRKQPKEDLVSVLLAAADIR